MSKCESEHCFLPKGHDGLHQAVARVYDIKLTEAEVKRSVEDYLQIAQNQGHLTFLRLNSGVAFMPSGKGKFYKIQLCPPGTADYLVIQRGNVEMFNITQPKISKSLPIAIVTFIELKKTKGKQSPEQVEFESMITSFNCRYVIVKSVSDLEEAL
ncbi:hypothetical protein LCGC14_0388090 [marine sediment metagenome]|uniref:VRR-NUC domain-containing protein n=1 Tax=marine sediment metagenome TaxID=412755 RepID=A0A0F9TIR4_9ZZZZ